MRGMRMSRHGVALQRQKCQRKQRHKGGAYHGRRERYAAACARAGERSEEEGGRVGGVCFSF